MADRNQIEDPHSARERLRSLLPDYGPTQMKIAERTAIAAKGEAHSVERLTLVGVDGERIRGFLAGPAGEWSGLPAVLYCHAHGNRFAIGASELMDGRPALLPEPYGPALARAGIVSLAIDLPAFGERAGESESAMAKRLLWHGRTLFGRMLSDLAGALAVIESLPGIDPARVGVFGFSMGATLAFWLAALEPRIRAAAHACAFADLATLIAQGGHDLHGPYMTVPGLLPQFSTGAIAGLIAPRPQLALVGALDPLTPPAAIAIAGADVRRAYESAGAGDAVTIVVDDSEGHRETPAMRAAVLAFLTGL